MKRVSAVATAVVSLCLMSLISPVFGDDPDRARPRFFQGRLSVSPVPLVGQRGAISLELTAVAGDCQSATIQFRTPMAVAFLSRSTFGDQYLIRDLPRRYSVNVEVLEKGTYALQATVYFQLSDGQNRAEHFLIYLTAGAASSWIEHDAPVFTEPRELQMKAGAMLAPSTVVRRSIPVSGYITYFDDNLAQELPIRRVAVELFERDEHGNQRIDSTFTDDGGFYSFQNAWVSVPKDGSTRSIYLAVLFGNDTLKITDSEDVLYRFESPVALNAAGGYASTDYSLDERNPYRCLGHIFNCVMDAHDFLLNNVGWERRMIAVKWPYGTLSRYGYKYSGWFGGKIVEDYILLGAGREWSRTTIIHEYGHSVMTALYGYNVNELPEMTSQRDIHYMYMVSDPGFAMIEGWAEFFEALVDDNAYNVVAYINTHTPNIESNSWWTGVGDALGANRRGELVEGAVASILWDIVDTDASRDDSPGVDDDDMSNLLGELWRLMENNKPGSILEFWYDWAGNYYSQPESLYAVFRRHGVKVNPPWDVSEDDTGAELVLTSGPFVSDVTATSAVIVWLTDEAGTSVVEYGTEPDESRLTMKSMESNVEHSILLSSLASDTSYEYYVHSTCSNGGTVRSGWKTFKTFDDPRIRGDVNCDGEVRSDDAILVLSIAIGTIEPTEYQGWAADMNDDGRIKANDAVLILRKAAGLAAR